MKNITKIRPGVKAFIIHEGKILVIKERILRDGQKIIIHDIPGGGMELGESFREALTREVMEEVGLTIDIHHPVGGWEFSYYREHEGVHIVCFGFQCTLIGEPKVNIKNNPAVYEDIFETLWLTKEEILASNDIFINADMRKALEHVKI